MFTATTSRSDTKSANHSLLKADELASRWRCHRNTIYKMIRDGELRSIRIRNTHLIAEEEIHRIESNGTGAKR